MGQHHRFLIGLAASCLGAALVVTPGTGWSQTRGEGNRVSQSSTGTVDPAVTKALAKYDASRDLDSLQEAGDEAARNDGEVLVIPAEAHARGMDRLAGWGEIFARFKRDIKPSFDPDKVPTMRITPPGPEGRQYMAGVDPKNVKDPVLRGKYVAALKENEEIIRDFSFFSRLDRIHRSMVEKAASSVADAHHTLGLPVQEITAVLQRADMQPSDYKALVAGVGQK